jgi:class 3 adenylate cyclase
LYELGPDWLAGRRGVVETWIMERSEELRRVVERFLAAFETGDGDLIVARMSGHPEVVIIGTDPNEWWEGPDVRRVFERVVDEMGGYPIRPNEIGAWEEGSCKGTVTIVFTDIVDSTLMLSRVGDAAWVEVIRRHNDLIEEVTAAHGGTVVERQGDGAMLALSSARRAVTCSQAIQHAIEREFADFSPPIRVRIGIHTGDAIREAEHFFGTTVHYAARVADQALGGEVLVSSLVRELVADGASNISFLEGRDVTLKGLEGSHRLYALASG